MQISILAGGTTERADSLISGRAVAALLQEAGHSPTVHILDDFGKSTIEAIPSQPTIIMLHGGFGEGGQLQGYLEMAAIPFSGSRSLASALALDKWFSKLLFREAGIRVPSARIASSPWEAEAAVKELGLPIVVKPINGGSSQDVKLMLSESDIHGMLASDPSRRWLLETFISGKNITVAILENKIGVRCFRPLQILLEQDVLLYDERAKTKQQRRYALFNSSESLVEQRLAELAVTCHKALGCFGPTRVDIIVDEQGVPFVLEVNTVPGMSENGNYRTAYRMSGVSDAEFCDLLIGSII